MNNLSIESIGHIVGIICGCLFLFAVLYSAKAQQRKKREKFKRELQGYKFGSLKELKDHWRGTIDISFGIRDEEFDPDYHGNLLETLKVIDEAVRKELIRWNS